MTSTEQEAFESFVIWKKRELNHSSTFGHVMLVNEYLNKNGIKWTYLHTYRYTKDDMIWYYYKEDSDTWFLLVNTPIPKKGKAYKLFITQPHGIFDKKYPTEWDMCEDVAKDIFDIIDSY